MKQEFDDLPVEIQEVMLAEQKRQEGREDPDAFREDIGGGFTWSDSLPIFHAHKDENEADYEVDMPTFWYTVLIEGDTELFFKYYPKKIKYETINIGGEVFNI